VKDLFSSRRKTIRNALKGGKSAARYGLDNILSSFSCLGIDTGLRGENLSVEALAAVVENLQQR
jgi:16S rRNA A1518/A1519 N6-dimethyltransferase RsmA/KsgA/DIM1 with predicted DNA glycosylase/AP lyase activity